jgi:hypothetical protein
VNGLVTSNTFPIGTVYVNAGGFGFDAAVDDCVDVTYDPNGFDAGVVVVVVVVAVVVAVVVVVVDADDDDDEGAEEAEEDDDDKDAKDLDVVVVVVVPAEAALGRDGPCRAT